MKIKSLSLGRLLRNLAFTIAATLSLGGCVDELEMTMPGEEKASDPSRVQYEGEQKNTHLVEDGTVVYKGSEYTTWRATERVPLVGMGRIVDNTNGTLINVGASDSNAENIVDLNITNVSGEFHGVGADLAYNTIVSVRDLNFIYKGGQKAGYVCKVSDNGLLNLSVAELYRLETYFKGEKQESATFGKNTNVLGLNVGQINTSKDGESVLTIEGTFSKPFDEIRLGVGGVNANVIKDGLKIYYAFVGENPIIPAVNGSSAKIFENAVFTGYFDNVKATGGDLVDSNLNNGIGVAISLVSPSYSYEVSFGKTVPAGTEVGFYVTTGQVLDLSIGVTWTLDAMMNRKKTGDQRASSNVLSLRVAGGSALYYSLVTTKECNGVKLNISGVGLLPGTSLTGSVHYAYVRERVTIDPSSYFAMANATVYNPSYRFPKIPGNVGNVHYDIVGNYGASKLSNSEEIKYDAELGCYYITGMDVLGNYLIKGTFTYTNEYGEEVEVVQYFTVTRKEVIDHACDGVRMTGSTDYTADHENSGWVGLQLGAYSQTGLDSYVVDDIEDNYMQWTINQLNLGANRQLIRVTKISDGNLEPVKVDIDGKSTTVPMRVGFEVVMNLDAVDANVINFLRIETYQATPVLGVGYNYTKVDGGVATGAVAVNVIQINKNEKRTRLYIETTKPFNAVALYYTGVLTLDIAREIKIYNAFYVPDVSKCNFAGDECKQLINNANMNAKVSYESEGLANIAQYAWDLGNVVDGDPASFGKVMAVGNVAQGEFLSVKFDPIRTDQEVGFILKNNVEVLGLISVLQLKALYQGNTVADTSSGGALSLRLIERGDYIYVSVLPTSYTIDESGNMVENGKKYVDELQLIFGDGANLGSGLRVCGAYMVPDIDNDGKIDCLEDNVRYDAKDIIAETDAYCYGHSGKIEVTGIPDGKYKLKFTNSYNNNVSWYEVYVDKNSYLVSRINNGTETPTEIDVLRHNKESIGTGKYYIGLYSVTGTGEDEILTPAIVPANGTDTSANDHYLTISVHPERTTWLGTTNTDWTNWSNWSDGEPWECTNVILPSPAKLQAIGSKGYPILSSTGDYRCDNIHFEKGAQLVGSQYLNHSGNVFVDMELTYDKYVIMGAPLRGLVTGDMFITKSTWNLNGSLSEAFSNWYGKYSWDDYDPYFVVADAANYVEQRLDPMIYQRFWAMPVTNEFMTRAEDKTNTPLLVQTDWSRTFNHVAESYNIGQAFALELKAKSGVTPINTTETLHFPKTHEAYKYYEMSGAEAGTNTTVGEMRSHTGMFWVDYNQYGGKTRTNFKLNRETSEGEIYTLGNPFLAYIDIESFLKGNSDVVSLDLYDDNQYITYKLVGNSLSATVGSNPYTGFISCIKPAQGVVLHMASAEKDEVTITADMAIQPFNAPVTKVNANVLSLSASVNSSSDVSTCLIALGGKDEFTTKEDVRLIMETEKPRALTIYTTADNIGLSINTVEGKSEIPIGFALDKTSNIKLTSKIGDGRFNDWYIYDSLTGKSYTLNKTVNLENVENGAGRFFLRHI